MKTKDAKKVIARFREHPKAYSRRLVEQAHQTLGIELPEADLLQWLGEREGIEGIEAARDIVADFDQIPLAYNLAQIKKAHLILGEEVDPERLKAWAKDNPAAPPGIYQGKPQKVAPEPPPAQEHKPRREPPVIPAVPEPSLRDKQTPGKDGILGTEDDQIDYYRLTVAELKDICKERGLSGYSSLKKAELIEFLLNDDQPPEEEPPPPPFEEPSEPLTGP